MPHPDPLVVTVPDPDWLERLGPWPAGVRALAWDVGGPPSDLGADADRLALVVLPYQRPAAALERLAEAPSLRLVQTLTAGYDDLVDRMPPGVPLSNAAGVHDASTAELAVGLAIASLRGLDVAAREQERGRWAPQVRTSLADRRVLVLGAGGVGTAIAARLEPFEVELTRVASRARDDEHSARFGPVHGVDELPELLPGTEVLVLACPLTDATRGLVDAGMLALLPDGALVVNVARGPVVVTADLLAELTSGRLRAAVDVVDPEPLPPDHPLWGAPGLLVSPHVGGATSAMVPRARRLVQAQLARLLAGEPPAHVVHGG
jgi:phosphoglycerate dehydrogenase-like enzyme